MPSRCWGVAVMALVFVLVAACGGSPPSVGQASAQPAGPEDKVLNVYNWSDYIEPTVIAGFERETGIKVNYDVFDSNEVLETKLLTGHTNYDVVVPSGPFLERQVKAGVYRKLDKSLLPNIKSLDPEVAQAEALYDPGNQYAVDFMWITSGPGYNVAKIQERMPDAPVDDWRLFFDPAVIAKFKDCGVSVLDAPTEVVATVLLYLGKDPNSQSPEDLKAAEQVLMSVRPFIRYVHSSRYIDDLANGEICLALGWSGDVKQAHDRAKEAGKGIELAYSIPKQGAIRNLDVLAIPADAPHPKNAHLFLDYLLRPDVAAKNSNFLKYANGDLRDNPALTEAVKSDPGIYPSAQVMSKLVPERAKSQEFSRLLIRAWTRFKTGQ
ncbi:MAG TPA: polyamine ABC transporter substrate-binding protein [Steroidobacteraceae bacterium]